MRWLYFDSALGGYVEVISRDDTNMLESSYYRARLADVTDDPFHEERFASTQTPIKETFNEY